MNLMKVAEAQLDKKTKEALEEFRSALNAHIRARLEKINVPKLAEKIVQDNINQLVPKLLGFNKSWHNENWEIDHCNGRAGQTEIGDFIQHQCQVGVRNWIDTVKKTGLPKPTKEIIAAVKKDYKDRLHREIRDQIWRQADEDAREFLSTLKEGPKDGMK